MLRVGVEGVEVRAADPVGVVDGHRVVRPDDLDRDDRGDAAVLEGGRVGQLGLHRVADLGAEEPEAAARHHALVRGARGSDRSRSGGARRRRAARRPARCTSPLRVLALGGVVLALADVGQSGARRRPGGSAPRGPPSRPPQVGGAAPSPTPAPACGDGHLHRQVERVGPAQGVAQDRLLGRAGVERRHHGGGARDGGEHQHDQGGRAAEPQAAAPPGAPPVRSGRFIGSPGGGRWSPTPRAAGRRRPTRRTAARGSRRWWPRRPDQTGSSTSGSRTALVANSGICGSATCADTTPSTAPTTTPEHRDDEVLADRRAAARSGAARRPSAGRPGRGPGPRRTSRRRRRAPRRASTTRHEAGQHGQPQRERRALVREGGAVRRGGVASGDPDAVVGQLVAQPFLARRVVSGQPDVVRRLGRCGRRAARRRRPGRRAGRADPLRGTSGSSAARPGSARSPASGRARRPSSDGHARRLRGPRDRAGDQRPRLGRHVAALHRHRVAEATRRRSRGCRPRRPTPLGGRLAWKGSTDQASCLGVSRSTARGRRPVPTRSPVTSVST